MSSISRPLVKNLNTISASSRPGLSLKVRLGAGTGGGGKRLLSLAFLFFLLKIAAGLMLGFTGLLVRRDLTGSATAAPGVALLAGGGVLGRV